MTQTTTTGEPVTDINAEEKIGALTHWDAALLRELAEFVEVAVLWIPESSPVSWKRMLASAFLVTAPGGIADKISAVAVGGDE